MVRLMQLYSIISLDGTPPPGAGLALGGSCLWQHDLLMRAQRYAELPQKKRPLMVLKAVRLRQFQLGRQSGSREGDTSCAMLACGTGSQFVHFLSSSLLIKTPETSLNTKTKLAGTWMLRRPWAAVWTRIAPPGLH